MEKGVPSGDGEAAGEGAVVGREQEPVLDEPLGDPHVAVERRRWGRDVLRPGSGSMWERGVPATPVLKRWNLPDNMLDHPADHFQCASGWECPPGARHWRPGQGQTNQLRGHLKGVGQAGAAERRG